MADQNKAINSEEEAPLLIENGQQQNVKKKGGKKKAKAKLGKGLGKIIEAADNATAPKSKKKKKKKKPKKKVSIFSLITNIKFLFFGLNIFTPMGVFVWWWILRPNNQLPYIVGGLLGLMVTTYGYRSFSLLIALTHEANDFAGKVQKMAKEHRALKKEVDSIGTANQNLKETEDRLRAANEKNRENLNNFRQVQETFKMLKVDDFKDVQNRVKNLNRKWHDEQLKQERQMLHTVFERVKLYHILPYIK